MSSQAFVDRYESAGDIATLLPAEAADGLTFVPTHPKAAEALAWMGFEARSAILEVLDQAIADKQAQVRVVAYDLNEPDVVTRLEKLGERLKIIIDDSKDHGEDGSGENQAAARAADLGRRRQREAAAHVEAPAQQDHRGRRPQGADGRVRLDQLQLAWVSSCNPTTP